MNGITQYFSKQVKLSKRTLPSQPKNQKARLWKKRAILERMCLKKKGRRKKGTYHKTSLSSPKSPPVKESKRNKVVQADQRPRGRPNNVVP